MSLAAGAPLVMRSRPGVLALLAGLLLVGLGLSVMIGTVPVGPARMIRALAGTGAADDPAITWSSSTTSSGTGAWSTGHPSGWARWPTTHREATCWPR